MKGRTVEHSATTISQFAMLHQAGRAVYAHAGEIMKLMDNAAGAAAVRGKAFHDSTLC